jgi:hypothetical protein
MKRARCSPAQARVNLDVFPASSERPGHCFFPAAPPNDVIDPQPNA